MKEEARREKDRYPTSHSGYESDEDELKRKHAGETVEQRMARHDNISYKLGEGGRTNERKGRDV